MKRKGEEMSDKDIKWLKKKIALLHTNLIVNTASILILVMSIYFLIYKLQKII